MSYFLILLGRVCFKTGQETRGGENFNYPRSRGKENKQEILLSKNISVGGKRKVNSRRDSTFLRNLSSEYRCDIRLLILFYEDRGFVLFIFKSKKLFGILLMENNKYMHLVLSSMKTIQKIIIRMLTQISH